MAKEIELKLLCDKSFTLDTFLAHLKSIATVSESKKGDNNDTYLDTRAGCFAAAGLSARLRKKGAKRQLDIKSIPIIPELIMSREEHSVTLKSNENAEKALKKWVEESWPIQLKGQAKAQLVIKSKRQKFILETSGYKAELSYDESMVMTAGQKTGPCFREMECEFISGDVKAFRFVCSIISAYDGLQPSQLSKYQRANLLLGNKAHVYAAPKPKFSALESLDEVARKICVGQYKTMLGYEPGTRVGLDLEHLHKMRVAVRRLRNALTLFSPCFDKRRLNSLKGHFRWLAETLGVVRDLDVQQVNQYKWQEQLGPEPKAGWDELNRSLKKSWHEGRKTLITALDSGRYKTLCQRAEALFSKTPRRRRGHMGTKPVAELAVTVICKRSRQFRKGVKAVRTCGTADSLHALRIIGKKLRYTSEYFRPILAGNIQKKIANLSDFQERLGDFNDNCVTLEFAAHLRQEALLNPAERGPYLYVLGQLYGFMLMATNTAQSECERALEEIGGETLTRQLDRMADRLRKSLEKKIRKAAARHHSSGTTTQAKGLTDETLSPAPRDSRRAGSRRRGPVRKKVSSQGPQTSAGRRGPAQAP
jgi:CHAD domain-containing protein